MPRSPHSSDAIAGDDTDAHQAAPFSPSRRRLIASAGLAAGGLAGATRPAAATPAREVANTTAPGRPGFQAIVPPPAQGRSPWGQDTASEPTPRPRSTRPGESPLPTLPRPYTDIKSYHAHIYFDEDTSAKAALIRRWVAERFPVELGNWNPEPRGPHVTPSFYFGFTNDLLPVVVPWLQLNSLGLTILIHPNTGDGRADHLHYALWVNRAQPVNAFDWPAPRPGEQEPLEQVFPNVVPTRPLET
ncbi:TPA: DOPA 4,5-dioxygenase family protein [Stenotrophomonas maltophilia]|uniref:DOPA 4,5-dioxygenase family protein n=1 Tax=Stenotrophomonas maltophilia TaxID=40324 RepID=UPI0021DAABD1|nr:DOPA 4,5-dioxygenase family protein [Stenotrophomonas maltophilia]UXY48040.1 DOPA 4,5-dioxygenase family protein [Stenotrophomonas maltophilia]